MSSRVFITGGSGFIGTNLIKSLEQIPGVALCNFDPSPTLCPQHEIHRINASILDESALAAAIEAFAPGAVVHLAARTDCCEKTTVEEGYEVNVEGTRNLVRILSRNKLVERLVIASSQFVCGPGHTPAHDRDYAPHTVYGQSKVAAEEITREADLDCTWTIIRPTNVWGPYHGRYAREFWRVLDRGWYWQPGGRTPTRSYAYVGNVVWQIQSILSAEAREVDRKVLYVGDRPVDIREWIEGFHREITGRDQLREIPKWLMQLGAVCGDGIGAVMGRPFLINSSRLRSMTTDYPVSVEETVALLGEPPVSLEAGIEETVEWFRSSKAAGDTFSGGGVPVPA